MEQNQKPDQAADTGAISTKARFPLLRRLSITGLVAMLVTATIMVLLYRHDQFAEHEAIAAQENEKTATHLTHLPHDRINTLISTAEVARYPNPAGKPEYRFICCRAGIGS